MRTLLPLLTALFLFANEVTAQQKDSLETQEAQIRLTARPQKEGKIRLRWAVTTAKAWRKLNTYGYELKRYTITQNKISLPQPIEKNLGVFKPKPLAEWEKLIETNDNAAVMGQSLYGETFEVAGIKSLSDMVNLSQEQEQRFTWGLYAADQDFATAQMAGLGYIDTEVQPNEKYVYKLRSLVPPQELPIQDGGIFIGLQDYEPLPKPLDLAGIFSENKTLLSWNYAIHKELYNSYFIERAEAGTPFQRLNALALSSLNNSNSTDPQRMFYVDSIANGKTYQYRILGKTIFGELSPVSEVVSGKGEKLLAYVPHITAKKFLDEKRVILEWEFPEEGNKEIKGFELNRSDKDSGVYTVVAKNIPPNSRKIQFDDLDPTNYMTLTALGIHGSNRTSFPALVQPTDSIPPAKPVGFKGAIDSLGVVSLQWEPNKDKDILGYRIFKGNNKTEEYSQITVSPHLTTAYRDSVSVANLNAKVYYQLVAVDEHYNMSVPSDILEIKKPDFIKPTQPIFEHYKITDAKVLLEWINSSSPDVIKHDLYRKEGNTPDWILVFSTPTTTGKPPLTSWTDTQATEGKEYSYSIVAVDESGLQSDRGIPLTLSIPKTSLAPAIKGLDSYIDKKNNYIELFWKTYLEPNATEIAIYKEQKGKPMSLFRNVLPTVNRIVDNQVQPNNEYNYLLRATFKDGSTSEITKLNLKF